MRAPAQTGPAPAGAPNWPMYNRDLTGIRFSALHQSDRSRFGHLFVNSSDEGSLGFRAFDSKAGRELWSVELDASAHAARITYAGKVAIVAGGNGTLDNATPGAEALAIFALP